MAPVYDLPDALDNPFVERVGMVQDVAHPTAGTLRMLSNPIKIDGERAEGAPGSALGADNDSVLGE